MRSDFCVKLRAELRSPSGKLLRRLRSKTGNSLLKQFIQQLTIQLQQSALTVTKTDGTSGSLSAQGGAFSANAGAGTTTYGILIGTGTNPVTMTDYKLQTQVSTNITHGVVTFAVENPDASTWRVSIARTFTNQTGSTLQIREVALYEYPSAPFGYVCLDRTLYSVDVPNGLTVTLTYRLTVTL